MLPQQKPLLTSTQHAQSVHCTAAHAMTTHAGKS